MRCIRNYIRLTVSLIALILTFFIFSGVNLAYESLHTTISTAYEEIYVEIPIVQEEIMNIDEQIEETLKNYEQIDEKWEIEIPSIGLSAPIAEGTSQEVMRYYVGHFENTNLWQGNIGLAAHNRRIPNKLF